MIKVLRVFLSFSLFLTAFAVPGRAAADEFYLDQKIPAQTGETYLRAYARTCSDTTWKKFAAWAKKERISERKFDSADVRFKLNSVSAANAKIRIDFGPKSIEADVYGTKVVGTDACDLILKYQKLSSAKHVLI